MRAKFVFILFLAGVLFGPVSFAENIYNGDFEQAEPNGLTDHYGATFYPPMGWERENYAAVKGVFIPYPPDYDDYRSSLDFWKIDVNEGISPVSGQSLVVVASGDMDRSHMVGSITQPVYVCPNQVISGYYFFGSTDWYNDYAYIKLIQAGVDRNSEPNEITLVSIDVSDVGASSSMENWGYFEHTISAEQSGGYDIVILARDASDEFLTSYIVVDGLTLSAYPLADLNHDCWVNFSDFNILARDWMQDCNDPAYLADQNNLCYKGSNIDEIGLVDNNDLMILTEQWLFQFKEPNEPNLPGDPNDPNQP